MSLNEHFLDRTIRLIKEELTEAATDELILTALNRTHVLIIATDSNARNHSAQTAIVSSALLMARCGLQVWLDVPDVVLAGPQPPLTGKTLATALTCFATATGGMLQIRHGCPAEPDIAIVVGDSPAQLPAGVTQLRLNGGRWTGILGDRAPWPDIVEPFGAMAAAAMACAEAFKCAMHRLHELARSEELFRTQFRINTHYAVSVAPESTPLCNDLGVVDLVSAGAVTNAALYALLHIKDVRGHVRINEPQTYDSSNHNRCMMMRGDSVNEPKAANMAQYATESLTIKPIVTTFQDALGTHAIDCVARYVIVGVDDIPTRWDVQAADPYWLSVGATTHWSAMSSFHRNNGPCARCLHPRNDDNAPTLAPTISFVSFWAGLWSAVYLVRELAGCTEAAEQVFLTPTTLSGANAIWKSPVAVHPLCPVHGAAALSLSYSRSE